MCCFWPFVDIFTWSIKIVEGMVGQQIWGYSWISGLRWIIYAGIVEIPNTKQVNRKKLWMILLQKWKDGNGTPYLPCQGMGGPISSKILYRYTPNLDSICRTLRQIYFENFVPQKWTDGNGTMVVYQIFSVSFASLKPELLSSGIFY